MNEVHPKHEVHAPAYHAYRILQFVFVVLPIIAGIDKFFNSMTNWGQYLSTPFNVFGDAHTTMMVVGVIEIIAGILVAIRTSIFAYLVAIWLALIIINLFVLGNFYDIILRDCALFLCAIALGRLSASYEG
jgi:hypothetical protein